jgi:hypothetical protein
MTLAHNPVIILTVNLQQIKEEMCNFFTSKGHVVLPSAEGARLDFPKSAVRGSWKRRTFVTSKCAKFTGAFLLR